MESVPTHADCALCNAQQVVLEYREDGSLVTGDEEPVVLAREPPETTAAAGQALAPGKLLRFAIGPGGMQVCETALRAQTRTTLPPPSVAMRHVAA